MNDGTRGEGITFAVDLKTNKITFRYVTPLCWSLAIDASNKQNLMCIEQKLSKRKVAMRK